MRKNLPTLVSCALSIKVIVLLYSWRCVSFFRRGRFAASQSPFKWQQQTKHKNKNCKTLSTGWIHTFATRGRCPLPGISRGILCEVELAACGCRPREFNLTTSNVLHATASAQQSESSTGILATTVFRPGLRLSQSHCLNL